MCRPWTPCSTLNIQHINFHFYNVIDSGVVVAYVNFVWVSVVVIMNMDDCLDVWMDELEYMFLMDKCVFWGENCKLLIKQL